MNVHLASYVSTAFVHYNKKERNVWMCEWEKKTISPQYLLHRYFCISLLLFQLAYLWSNKHLKHESQHKKRSFSLRISSVNLTKSLMENFIFCAVSATNIQTQIKRKNVNHKNLLLSYFNPQPHEIYFKY